jgi:DNA-binding MarR family transcriptional regulator
MIVKLTAPFRPGLFLQPFVVSQLVGSVIAEIVEGTGLSGTEFAVVSSLALWDDPTPTALAHTLGMPPTTLSAILKRLERRDLVRRARDPADRRRHVLRLSPEGRRARDRAVERFPRWLERVKDHLGGDPEHVLEPMRRLEAALRAALADARQG